MFKLIFEINTCDSCKSDKILIYRHLGILGMYQLLGSLRFTINGFIFTFIFL